jgi:isoleucyl-tRNA synthetase
MTAPLDLKKTVNLPCTDFPMKANLPTAEPKMLAHWNHDGLYPKIRAARAGGPMYVLHDGPPYANGDIHLGHAFNKILKDFIVKLKTMEGYDSPYIPGWDCHGLPIEIKVDGELGSKKANMSVAQIRAACRTTPRSMSTSKAATSSDSACEADYICGKDVSGIAKGRDGDQEGSHRHRKGSC